MPLLRSNKIVCFYCNVRSNQEKTAGLRQWHCENCEADNFLDENGDITEPPVASTHNQTTRYAQPKAVDPRVIADPVSQASPDPTFCATCLKNQRLYTESLANFYPSPTPNGPQEYQEYEQAEKQYRAGLEHRYPLVCERCEPAARERLKRANYNAKADNVGRLMLRLGGRGTVRLGWKGFIVWLGGFMWALSWLLQLSWHGVGPMQVGPLNYGYFPPGYSCVKNMLANRDISSLCLVRLSEGAATYSLWLALLSFWWHPKMRERMEKPFGKLIGKRGYYQMQAVTLVFRFIAWYGLTGEHKLSTDSIHGIHVFMTLFSIATLIITYRSITTDYTPRATWKESPESLIRHRDLSNQPSFNDLVLLRNQPNSNHISPHHDPLIRGSQPRPINFNILDHSIYDTQLQHPGVRLPTPPPEDDYWRGNNYAMDWQPTVLPPKRPEQQLIPTPLKPRHEPPASERGPIQPSHGPAHGHLAQPQHLPSLKRLLPKQKKAKPIYPPCRRETGHPLDLVSLTSALGEEISPSTIPNNVDSPKSIATPSPERKDGASFFKHPRFFAPSREQQAETGLEDLIEQSFRIGVEPLEVAQHRQVVHTERENVLREERAKAAIVSRNLMGLAAIVVLGAVWAGYWKLFVEKDEVLREAVGGAVKGFLAVE